MQQDTPCIPIELVEQIVLETWALPLSEDDRVNFMTSSLLVNRMWMTLFVRISSQEVHIPCPSYVDRFVDILRGNSSIYNGGFLAFLDQRCQSINATIANAPLVPAKGPPPMGEALDRLLYMLNSIPHVPNLRTLRIQYQNIEFDYVVEPFRFVYLPIRIVNLELTFSFDSRTPSCVVDKMRGYAQPSYWPWHMPSLCRLSMLGATSALMTDFRRCCPNAGTHLETAPIFTEMPTLTSNGESPERSGPRTTV
jgi:hypothetical protein